MKNQQKHKREFSKALAAVIVAFGMLTVVAYYAAVFSDHMVDAAVAVAGISQIIGGGFAYLLYQLGLKNSRNKYGIDADGQPYEMKQEDEV